MRFSAWYSSSTSHTSQHVNRRTACPWGDVWTQFCAECVRKKSAGISLRPIIKGNKSNTNPRDTWYRPTWAVQNSRRSSNRRRMSNQSRRTSEGWNLRWVGSPLGDGWRLDQGREWGTQLQARVCRTSWWLSQDGFVCSWGPRHSSPSLEYVLVMLFGQEPSVLVSLTKTGLKANEERKPSQHTRSSGSGYFHFAECLRMRIMHILSPSLSLRFEENYSIVDNLSTRYGFWSERCNGSVLSLMHVSEPREVNIYWILKLIRNSLCSLHRRRSVPKSNRTLVVKISSTLKLVIQLLWLESATGLTCFQKACCMFQSISSNWFFELIFEIDVGISVCRMRSGRVLVRTRIKPWGWESIWVGGCGKSRSTLLSNSSRSNMIMSQE